MTSTDLNWCAATTEYDGSKIYCTQAADHFEAHSAKIWWDSETASEHPS